MGVKMKKIVIIWALILLMTQLAGAQIVQRTTQMPNFFIPNNALKTESEAEKLPPVEKMLYDGKPAPIVLEMQQKQQETAARKAEIAAAKNNVSAPAEQAEKQTQTKPSAEVTQIVPQNVAPKTVALPKPEAKEPEEENPAATQAEDYSPTSQQPIAAAAETTQTEVKPAENHQPQAVAGNQDPFQVILDEYHRDIQYISAEKPFQNDRLRNMIADYQNIDRAL